MSYPPGGFDFREMGMFEYGRALELAEQENARLALENRAFTTRFRKFAKNWLEKHLAELLDNAHNRNTREKMGAILAAIEADGVKAALAARNDEYTAHLWHCIIYKYFKGNK
jgi:hypothetical protein